MNCQNISSNSSFKRVSNWAITWEGKRQSFITAVIQSNVFHDDGHLFRLVLVHVPLEGRNGPNVSADSIHKGGNKIGCNDVIIITGGVLLVTWLPSWMARLGNILCCNDPRWPVDCVRPFASSPDLDGNSCSPVRKRPWTAKWSNQPQLKWHIKMAI